MLQPPYMHLQAFRDFSAFQFTSRGMHDPVTRQVRFNGQGRAGIYNLDLQDLPVTKKDDPGRITDLGDMETVLATLIQIVEIYTERYPQRTVQLRGDTPQKDHLYWLALQRYKDILRPLFFIDVKVNTSTDEDDLSIADIAYLLKRKPIPFFSLHTVQTTWSGHSRLFGRKVTIEMDKEVRVGIALPKQ